MYLNKRAKKFLDIFSFVLALASLIVTIPISIYANEISKRSQPLEFSVTTTGTIKAFSYNDEMYSTGGVIFKQLHASPAGEYGSVFVASVVSDSADVVLIPRESGFAYTLSNGMKIFMTEEFPNTLYFAPHDMTAFENLAAEPQIFHLLFKGYNREYTVFSVVCMLDGSLTQETLTVNDSREESVLTGTIKCFIIDEDNLYDPKIYEQISDSLISNGGDASQYSSDKMFDLVIDERKAAHDSLKLSH